MKLLKLFLFLFLCSCTDISKIKEENDNIKKEISKIEEETLRLNKYTVCIDTLYHTIQITSDYLYEKITPEEIDEVFDYCEIKYGNK